MTTALTFATEVLERFGYAIEYLDDRTATFENHTILGFVIAYPNARELLGSWAEHQDASIQRVQFQLRTAGEKAWNTYFVFLAEDEADEVEVSALSLIEEDLRATRKIARAGVRSTRQAQTALLSLLPLQSAPVLERVDMEVEITSRATDVPKAALQAFLSGADESLVLQILGEAE